MTRIIALAFFACISIGFAACSGGGCGQQEESKVTCGSGTRLVTRNGISYCEATSANQRF